MKVLYIILSCDKYVPTRCEWARKSWIRDSHYVILSSTPDRTKGVLGWNTDDSYQEAPQKYIAFLKNTSIDADFYVFCDDDTFVFTDRLEAYLAPFDSSKRLCIGYEQVHPDLRTMSGGAGFVLSRSCFQAIQGYIRSTPVKNIRVSHYTDISMTLWLQQFHPINIHEPRFHTGVHSTEEEIKSAFTFHYVSQDLFDLYSSYLPPRREPCIKAFSFTCLRDLHLVIRIRDQLTKLGISHTMYVDETEINKFPFECKSRGLHPDGTNGFGRGGYYAKLVCIRDMIANTQPGDTILDCDSDVLFDFPEDVFLMKCESDEYKGWHGPVQDLNGISFRYCSGAVKSYSRELAEKISGHDHAHAIKTLMNANYTPSEDCTTSYIAGIEGRVTDMNPTHYWEIRQSPDDFAVHVRRVERSPPHGSFEQTSFHMCA